MGIVVCKGLLFVFFLCINKGYNWYVYVVELMCSMLNDL